MFYRCRKWPGKGKFKLSRSQSSDTKSWLVKQPTLVYIYYHFLVAIYKLYPYANSFLRYINLFKYINEWLLLNSFYTWIKFKGRVLKN